MPLVLRTDTGVSATAMLLHIDLQENEFNKFVGNNTLRTAEKEINNFFVNQNQNIKILNLRKVERSYNSWRIVKGKRYSYYFTVENFSRKFQLTRFNSVWLLNKPEVFKYNKQKIVVDENILLKSCSFVLGEKNFRCFTRSENRRTKQGRTKVSTIRCVDTCRVEKVYFNNRLVYKLIFEGSGFLYLMIRCLVMGIVCTSIGKVSLRTLQNSLKYTGVEKLGQKPTEEEGLCTLFDPAPAEALCLEKVFI
eukprot:snap_masked-scaffold_13-processed-gene-3.48-mRNA-1 protein AED:1.00 eAED:1.00 QI:0/0/0/0/1/1/2/0/249